MKVPFLYLDREHREYRAGILRAVNRVLDKTQFILGPEVAELEKKFATYCGGGYGIGVNSGTDALYMALKVMGVGPGDEVITAPNSFVASASTIALTGAKPVFADVACDLNINPGQVEKKITRRTKAVMPVHLTGKPAAMGELMKIARKHGLKVVEDAAQAIGAESAGRRVGSFGIGCFSLHPLKNLSVCGDGGMIVTKNKKLAERLKLIRNIGIRGRNDAVEWAGNSRLDTLQAAIALVKFRDLEKKVARKRAIAGMYNAGLEDTALYVPAEIPGERQVYQNYIMQVPRRDALMKYLQKNGVDAKIHYPEPLHTSPAGRRLGYRKGNFPVTEELCRTMITLPCSVYLSDAQVRYVIKTVREFYKK